MVKNKVYLSLDDLNKLYGISPDVIKQIKKKRRKRRLKKQLKDSFGGPKSSSEHMVGSSQSYSNEFKKKGETLGDALVLKKHLEDIKTNSDRVSQPYSYNYKKGDNVDDTALTKHLNDIKSVVKTAIESSFQEPVPDIFDRHGQALANGVRSGDIIMKKNAKSISFKPKIETSKTIRGRKAKEVFETPPNTDTTSTLAGISTRTMNRENPDDVVGNIDAGYDEAKNDGSDGFTTDYIPTPEEQQAIDDKRQEQQQQEAEQQQAEQQQAEQQQQKQQQQLKAEKQSLPTIEDLKAIATQNNIKYNSNVSYGTLLKKLQNANVI